MHATDSEGEALRISIDSTEPLEDVLRVVGAMYGVTVTVAPAGAATVKSGSTSRGTLRSQRSSGSRGVSHQRARKRATRNGSAPVSQAQVRSWARENGHTVSDRGRLPADVVAAYRAAN